MIHVEESTTLSRERDEVFRFITDVSKLPSWQTGIVDFRPLSEGPMRVGFQIAEAARVGPWNLRMICTVTDFKPNERFAFKVTSDGPLDCDVLMDLQPVAGGTRLTLHGNAKLTGAWRLLTPLVGAELRRESRTELATLKMLLESAAPVRAGRAS